MPHINFKLYPGRDEAFKETLAEKIRECLAEESGCWSTDDISVSVEEIAPADFEAKTRESFRPEELLFDSKWITRNPAK